MAFTTNNGVALGQLVACLIQVIGRTAMQPDQVRELVGKGRANLKAFNMCDGTYAQKDIAEKLHIDPGNLSRMFSRWVQSGIAFRIGEGNEARLLHIYAIQEEKRRKPPAPKKRRQGPRAARG